jgi:hypothetical protein
MKLIQLLENQLIDIYPLDIKIENGIMIPNQFPDKVEYFNCFELEQLTSLENCPKEVESQFFCDKTSITSLRGCPKIVGNCFSCQETNITSLEYAPLKCNKFKCGNTNILHLKGIGRSYLKECKEIELPITIKSNILGLCRVKNLINIDSVNRSRSLDLWEAIKIISKYLETDGSECQEELIQNGFNDYAKF